MDHSVFQAHGWCYLWTPSLIWLHVISDAAIVLAYMSIPAMLWYELRLRVGLDDDAMILRWFIAFIILCGLTHLMNIVVIWNPLYYLEGAIKALTGFVSLCAAWKVGKRLAELFRVFDAANDEERYELIRAVLLRLQRQAQRHVAS